MDQQSKLHYPVIILIRGLPGSGKSYITKPLAEAVEQIVGEPAIILDPDATDYKNPRYLKHVEQLNEEGIDPKLHAYRFLRAQAYDGIASHRVIIWNQPFTNLEIFNKMVDRFHEHAESVGTTFELLVVEVNADPAAAKERVEARKKQGGHGPSDATFERFVHDYTSFAPEGYKTVAVNGQDDVKASVETILETVRDMLGLAQGKR